MILQFCIVCGFVITLVTGVSWFVVTSLYVILQLHFMCGYTFTLVTGVPWFLAICLNMILQIHFVCGFVFTLVTGVSWFFASYLNMILQIVFVCGFVFRGITILCELSLLHWFIFISTVCFSLCIVFKCLFCVVSQFKSFFTCSPGVLFSPWIIFMYCLVLFCWLNSI